MNRTICKGCGGVIPEARVEALPGTRLCISCAEGRVPKKLAVTSLVGGEEHGYTDVQIVSEDMFSNYEVEQRDILDVEPETFAKDEGIPIKIKKRNEL